jgi:TPR repeat protein
VTVMVAMGILKARAEKADADALGPYGSSLSAFCGVVGHGPAGIDCRESVTVLTKSAELGDPYSMHNLAVAYRLGIGAQKSMYAAAEWYLSAAQVFIARSMREAAMAELESALEVVPGHPKATETLKTLISN